MNAMKEGNLWSSASEHHFSDSLSEGALLRLRS